MNVLYRVAQQHGPVLGDSDALLGRPLYFAGWSMSTEMVTTGLAFRDLVQHFPSRAPSNRTSQIDAAWLAGADVAVIETGYVGRVTRSLEVAGFQMRR